MESIVLIGSGGHAKSIIDVIEMGNKYSIAGLISPKPDEMYSYRGYRIIGTDNELEKIYNEGIRNAFICVGYMGKGDLREQIYNKLKKTGFNIPVIIDSTAILARDVIISEGTFIGKNAIINSNSKIGKMTIINTASIIEHDCVVEDYSHVSVGTTLCGGVYVGKRTFIGANSIIIQGVRVSDDVIIGAGSVITKTVPANSTVVGNPGKII